MKTGDNDVYEDALKFWQMDPLNMHKMMSDKDDCAVAVMNNGGIYYLTLIMTKS